MKNILILILIYISVYAQDKKPNALFNEESPYLKQHAYNPVKWYAWKKESLELAQKENKLIFVSIGYSTCHWCHVMEKESFKNKNIAKLLNKNYISIKIDKEEMPHLDTAFQEIHSKLNQRRNGWPLNFILTPEQKLVFITTYIPPSFNYGVEGMDTLIPKFAQQYTTKDPKLLKIIAHNEKIIQEKTQKANKPKEVGLLDNAFISRMNQRYDKIYKGFDKQPKFPLASHLNLLNTLALLNKDSKIQKMFYDSLTAMSYGGIFDQIEGAFYRYSVYPDWVIPHFEKMLYTQAELIPIFLKAYIQTNKRLYRSIIEKTINETNKKFKNDEELFYSALDADSLNHEGEKEEGFYYTYTYDEAKSALLQNGIRNYQEILEYLGIDEEGNFEEEFSNIYIFDYKQKPPNHYKRALQVLKRLRLNKQVPFIDKKVITSWNALYIKALFEASYINQNYLKQAIKSIDSLLKNLYIKEQLYHQKFNYNKPSKKALLEDYVFLTDALLSAYSKTYNKGYLELAQKFHDYITSHFYKKQQWYLDEEKKYAVNFKDKNYTAPIARFFHNGLTLANITSNLKQLEQTKIWINEQKNRILNDISAHPEAIRALIRMDKGDIILKSNVKNLIRSTHMIKRIKYPFILTSPENTKMILACDEKSCFTYSKNIKDIIRIVDK